jgi:predicted transposase YdaD
LIQDLTHQPTGLDYLYTLLRYVSGAAPQLDAEELQTAVIECITQGETLMPTIAEKWLEQGRNEGRDEGRDEGRLEGEAAVLRRQLTRRFGPLPEWAEERLTHADLTQLETWADRGLDADTLDAIFQ